LLSFLDQIGIGRFLKAPLSIARCYMKNAYRDKKKKEGGKRKHHLQKYLFF
jgi:hypothetical protein